METRTGSFGSNENIQKFKDYVSSGVTMEAGEYPVTITLGLTNGGARWWNQNISNPLQIDLYLVSDNNWTNYVLLDSWTMAGSGSSYQHNSFTLSASDGKKFKGKTLYFRMQNTVPTSGWDSRDYTVTQHRVTVTVTTNYDYHSITCSAGTGGSLSANTNSAIVGTQITLTPTANSGYHFTNYTTSPSVTISNNKFTMPDSDVMVTANFAKTTYTITCSAGTGGSLSASADSAVMGTQITLTPTAQTGYELQKYTSSPVVTISNNKFTMPAGNVTITAAFVKKSYSITKNVSPTGAGTLASSANSAVWGTQITLTPTAAQYYHFSSYSTSPSVTITNNKFEMPKNNVTVTANFAKDTYAITKAVNPSGGGTLASSVNTAAWGTEVTLTPTAASGYSFSSYSSSPSVTITNNKFTMPKSAVTITANFSKTTFAITRAVSPSGSGTLTASASSATAGTTITLTPSPATGYQFSSWSSSPSVTITNNKFTMPSGAVTITANFTKKTYTITKGANPAGGGTVTAASSAQMGDQVSVSQSAASGYTFSGWTTNPSVTIANGKFTMPAANISVTANYTKNVYTVSKAITPSGGGTVSLSRTSASIGDRVTVTATPATGYYLVSILTSPRTTVSNNAFTMPASNVTVTATFAKQTYTITKAASPSAGGTVTVGAQTAKMNDSVSVSQTPASGYYFDGWTTSPSLTISGGTFTMPASNVSITAKYLKYSTASLNKTTLTGGSSVTLTITADKNTYTHKYKLSFGTGMETSLTSVAAGTSTVSISVPESWSDQIPNATSKTGGTLTLETYNGSTKIGTVYVNSLTYSVPASVKPTIGTVTKSIVRTIGSKTYANVGNYYVQSHCGIRVQAAASGARSSTIASIALALTGYSGSSYNTTASGGSLDFTTGLLTKSGTLTMTITATDSRGRTATKTETVTVTAYSKPSASLTLKRVDSNGDDDDMGTYAKYTIANKRYSQIGSNSLTTTLKYSTFTAGEPNATGDIMPGSRKTFNIQNEYTVQLVLADAFETVTITGKVPSAKFIFYVNASGNKIGFMKAATHGGSNDKTIEFDGDSTIYIGDRTLSEYIQYIVNNM